MPHWGCCCCCRDCFVPQTYIRMHPICYTLYYMQSANQSYQTTQPFPQFVCLSVNLYRPCLVAAVSALFCSSSSLSLTVSSGYNGANRVARGTDREREREGALVRAVTALLSIYLGPARFMHIRHGKLPETETEISYRFLCLKIYTEMQLKIGETKERERARELSVN